MELAGRHRAQLGRRILLHDVDERTLGRHLRRDRRNEHGVRELDDRTVGPGAPGELTRRLQELFFAIVRGKEERYRSWLAYL